MDDIKVNDEHLENEVANKPPTSGAGFVYNAELEKR